MVGAKINNIPLPANVPEMALICLGNGKSAYFFISNTHPDIPALIVTEHKTGTDKIIGPWKQPHQYQQVNSATEVADFIKDNPNRKIVFTVTTYPERGKELLDKLFNPLNKELGDLAKLNNIIFFIPHSPNPFIKDFVKLGTVIISDYFQGIGSVSHDPVSRTAKGRFGAKELVRYNIIAKDTESKHQALQILPFITLNQRTIEHETAFELALLPTNALLHSAGVISYVAHILVEKNLLDKSAMQPRNSEEFFKKFNEVLKNYDQKSLIDILGGSLKDKAFYREMPHIGPNIIMDEISKSVTEIRQALIERNLIPASDLDLVVSDSRTGAHIFNHLREKYQYQFRQSIGKYPDEVSFGDFVNNNPPYQNPHIVFPTKPDGRINTEHRFFNEELPTMTMLLRLGEILNVEKKSLKALKSTIEINQFLCEKEYLKETGELGKNAPVYMHRLKTSEQFANLANTNIRELR